MINNDANKVDYWRSLAQACKDIADSFEKQNATLKEENEVQLLRHEIERNQLKAQAAELEKENEALKRIVQNDAKLMQSLNDAIQTLKTLNEGLVFENRGLRNHINNRPFPSL